MRFWELHYPLLLESGCENKARDRRDVPPVSLQFYGLCTGNIGSNIYLLYLRSLAIAYT